MIATLKVFSWLFLSPLITIYVSQLSLLSCSSNDTKCQDEQDAAQEEVSRLQLYIAASRHIPAFFSSLLLGPFTDRLVV